MQLNHRRAGTGEPLVLIHGIGSHLQMWDPVLPMLERSHEVIALDLPGFGGSPMPPPGTPPGLDSLCTLVTDFLREQGVERPHLAGNSLGGMIVLELARRGTARSACALSPAGFFNPLETGATRATLWAAARLTRWLSPRANGLLARPRGRILLMNAFAAHPDRIPATEAVSMVAAYAAAPWFDDTLQAIAPWNRDAGAIPGDVPVTVLWGDKDRILWPWQGTRAVRAIPSAELIGLPDCGHLPTFDDPELVAQLMLAATARAADDR